MIMVSACLAGREGRYDGSTALSERIADLVRKGETVVPFCPETVCLPVPREPAEITGGTGEDVLDGKARITDRTGRDVTEEFLRGARAMLEKAKELQPELIILREKSPSCGVGLIHDGSFTGALIAGSGVTAALLKRNGFRVEAI